MAKQMNLVTRNNRTVCVRACVRANNTKPWSARTS